MTASSILVLTAMTVTGVYIYNSNQGGEPENNVVDFSALEEETTEGEQVAQAENSSAQNLTSGQENTGELDYDPYYAEADRKLNEAGAASEQEEAAQQAQAGAEAGALPDAGTAQQEEMSVGYAEIDRSPQDDAAEEAPEGESGEGGESAGESGAESADGGAGTEDGQTASIQEASAQEADGQALEAVADVAAEESNLRIVSPEISAELVDFLRRILPKL